MLNNRSTLKMFISTVKTFSLLIFKEGEFKNGPLD